MIYLKHTTDAQMMCVPRGWRDVSGKMTFKAENTVERASFQFSASLVDTTMLYHKVRVTLSSAIPAGEYEYSFSDEVGEISKGLLVVGDSDNAIEYDNMTEYEQYE